MNEILYRNCQLMLLDHDHVCDNLNQQQQKSITFISLHPFDVNLFASGKRRR